jgi:hypothetical protein
MIALQTYPQTPGSVLINEILFNPPKNGYDYVEGYNKSEQMIDLRELLIASRNSTGDIAGMKPVAHDSAFLPPGAYFVVTTNEKWLRQYFRIPSDALVYQASIPSFADDNGTVLFINRQDSVVVDELAYSDKWHFALIADPSGIALERITLSFPTQDKNNWTSAASSAGYGTPGYKNSQFVDALLQNDEIQVPSLFSPDNDGVDDTELIGFRMKEKGFIANTIIYDMSGRKVRYLIKNESIGGEAVYKWDGLDERSQALPQGIYIAITEMFTLDGKTKRFKNAITLARK